VLSRGWLREGEMGAGALPGKRGGTRGKGEGKAWEEERRECLRVLQKAMRGHCDVCHRFPVLHFSGLSPVPLLLPLLQNRAQSVRGLPCQGRFLASILCLASFQEEPVLGLR